MTDKPTPGSAATWHAVVLCADGSRHYLLGQENNFRDIQTATEWADEFSDLSPACGGKPHVIYKRCVCND